MMITLDYYEDKPSTPSLLRNGAGMHNRLTFIASVMKFFKRLHLHMCYAICILLCNSHLLLTLNYCPAQIFFKCFLIDPITNLNIYHSALGKNVKKISVLNKP